MKRQSKGYETPVQGWQEDRIATETDLQEDYGLANKREVWKAQSAVRDFRRQARKLNAEENEQMEGELVGKLVSLGILDEGAALNDVLDIHVEDVLDRRLQTIVYRRGLAETMQEARQIVNHGHIAVGDRVVDIPGYLVTEDEETEISVAGGSEHVVEER
ncbi:MAG: 30S ribosomal protein S4 [Candidatus Nanohaloarchaea archaeon]|nr:30S ribosomal protein S4 [Candidatus Nanohaloarchaea archaeon]